ncbi:MAG: cobalt ABC transporter permease [Thermodesulfovibrio sp.]|nr:cobalt ABC transporter permease [Thermodesulfovibrio sp.]
MFLLIYTVFFLFPAFSLQQHSCGAESEKWQGIDESVVKKFAKEHGREAKEPLINTDQGDLLLFVFLLAGTIGGFVGGYYWRMLAEQKQDKSADGTGNGHGNIH